MNFIKGNPLASSPGKIIICSAPSGAGKTTLLNHLRSAIPGLAYSISATTRKPRSGERDGEQYFFYGVDEFKRKIELGDFAEWQVVHGNYYGTPRAFADATICSGTHLVMDIDVRGKAMFDKTYPEAHGILILPPSLELLEMRLRARNTDSEDDIVTRMTNARTEVEFARTRGSYEYTIINDDLRLAQDEMVKIVKGIISSS